MSKILIIGPSGSGKTYISSELKKGGVNAVDTDSIPGLSGWFDERGNKVEYPEDAGKEFLDTHNFFWDVKFLKGFLQNQNNIYLFGLSGNIFDIINLFDRVYFLKVEQESLRKNLRHETRENPMGRTDYQLQNALNYADEIENKARQLGILMIEATNKTPGQIYKELSNA